MNKYTIISTSYYDDGHWKDFTILYEGLTKNQVLALKNTIPLFLEECKSKHPLEIYLEIDGFEVPIRGDDFQGYISGKIVPMWSLQNFE